MLLLDYQNVLIESLLKDRFSGKYCFPLRADITQLELTMFVYQSSACVN